MSHWLLVTCGLLSLTMFHQVVKQESPAVSSVQSTSIKHLAVIMDGNRRWAKKNAFTRSAAYKQGIKTLHTVMDYCVDHSISTLSVYAFSLENLQRNPEEVQGVFQQFAQEAHAVLPDLIKRNIAVRFIGDRRVFPDNLIPLINSIEEQTAHCSLLRLNVLFCYGGKQEILAAAQQLVKNALENNITTPLTEEMLKNSLWTKEIPPVDLVIRTGGFKRLSNFMPYQTAYSELYFIDTLWPDLTEKDLDKALHYYAKQTRTFGK